MQKNTGRRLKSRVEDEDVRGDRQGTKNVRVQKPRSEPLGIRRSYADGEKGKSRLQRGQRWKTPAAAGREGKDLLGRPKEDCEEQKGRKSPGGEEDRTGAKRWSYANYRTTKQEDDTEALISAAAMSPPEGSRKKYPVHGQTRTP